MNTGDKPKRQRSSAPKWFIYPFFMFHMFMFGMSGFALAYATTTPDVLFLYMHGGIAITVYLVFYRAIFGAEEVKWMFINAGLGIFGIFAEINWLMSLLGRDITDYPFYVHVIPFLYYVLYTFLLRQLVLDITRSRKPGTRRKIVEYGYIVVSIVIYTAIFVKTR